MHTRNPILDDLARLSTAAVGLAQAAGEEAKSAMRAGTDRLATDLDLVRRDEFEAQLEGLRREVAGLRAEVERLKNDQQP